MAGLAPDDSDLEHLHRGRKEERRNIGRTLCEPVIERLPA